MISTILRKASLVAALWPASGWAATYYVSVAGSDSNSGLSSTSAFRTIQRAADIVVPGDIVLVGDGVFTTTSAQLINVWRSGTPGAWITFRSANKWGAKLSGRDYSTTSGVYVSSSVNYVRFEDFELSGFRTIAFSLRGSNITLKGNLVHDIGRFCTDMSTGIAGYYSQGGVNITLDRNIFHDIGRLGPGENGCAPGNLYYQNHDHGLYVDGTHNLSVTNNLFYNIGHGWPIQLYPGTSNGLRVLNNTFIGANRWRDGHIYIYASLNNAIIKDNVMKAPRRQAVSYGSGSMSNVIIQSNTVFPGVITADRWPGGVTFTGNRSNTNPGSFLPEAWTP